MSRLSGSLFALLLAVAVSAGAGAATLSVGADQQYKKPSDALAAAKDGDTVEIAPGEYYDCAIVKTNDVTIAGTGPADKVVLTDQTCGGKAILVLDGARITVKNLTLARARVADGNGAGIRAEGGDLTIDGVTFLNNQDGILTADNQQATLTIRNSRFEKNGACDQACSHGIYVGRWKLLRVEGTSFIGTKRGHHLKSRALRTEVTNCDFSDGPDGTASYEVEVPNGGALVVRDSRFEKGPNAENHKAIISIGAEGVKQPTPEIVIANNTARNDGDFSTNFVVNLTATEALLQHNKLSGSIEPLSGDGKVE